MRLFLAIRPPRAVLDHIEPALDGVRDLHLAGAGEFSHRTLWAAGSDEQSGHDMPPP